MAEFSHITPDGTPRMVDVGHKEITRRTATAVGRVTFQPDAWQALVSQDFRTGKGAIFQTAIVAGIQGVKKCSDLIPMCHPLPVDGVDLTIEPVEGMELHIECRVHTTGKTGVEMEALTGVTTAALTVYDMCKSMGHQMVIGRIQLKEKSGGKSGYRWENTP